MRASGYVCVLKYLRGEVEKESCLYMETYGPFHLGHELESAFTIQ